MPDNAVIPVSSEGPGNTPFWIDVADVVVDSDAPDLQPVYSYRIPAGMQATLRSGACVHVRFHGRELLGFVMDIRKLISSDPLAPKLQDILAILDEAAAINHEQLQTVVWMTNRYVCDPISAVRCVAPAVLGSKVVTKARLTGEALRGECVTRSVPQAHIVSMLLANGGESDLDSLRESAALRNFSSAYAALVSKRIIAETIGIADPRVVAKRVRVYALSRHTDRLLAEPVRQRSPQQQRIINVLVEHTGSGASTLTGAEISQAAQASASSLKGLVDKGIVTESARLVRRAPYTGTSERTAAPVLSREQYAAALQIRSCIASGQERAVLLFGVTASGKTEIYLDAISHALARGCTAIVLVPEIALTTQVVDIFVGRFGEQVAVLHSRLSEGERHDEWRRLQQGQARIVIGARSAIFAPLTNVGLIVVDEEHETSYKQEKSPRYNAREVAAERARISGATLLLGSATPSIETYWASREQGTGTGTAGDASRPPLFPRAGEGSGVRVRANRESGVVTESAQPILRITMTQRIDSRPMPRVTVVDMRQEFKGRPTLFSGMLSAAIGARLQAHEQTILFLNHRGYSQFVLCRTCGWTKKCVNCAISMAFHRYENCLKCHHCGYLAPTQSTCPECHGSKVRAFGLGTEKVEEEVLRLFPEARVSRMDRDTTSTKGSHGRILNHFRQQELDVLIGTQMVAKGLDFPNVTLVGVVTADTAINVPDFRAAERTFQLLAQVAGRSGRGERPGEVIIQTFSPDHYAVRAAVNHNYLAFYEQEIKYRKELNYPPFSRLANIICSHERESAAKAHSSAVAAALFAVKTPEVEIIGPSPAPIARIKNQFRYHVALRAPITAPLSQIVKQALAGMKREERRGLSIDIDPLSMA